MTYNITMSLDRWVGVCGRLTPIALILIPLGCSAPGGGSGQGLPESSEWECSRESFAELPTADTARMRSRQVDWHPSNASEGVLARAFYNGASPEVIAVTTFGESGRAVTTYRIRSRDDYQATHTVYRYSEPITLDPGSEDVESNSVLVFCEGRAEEALDPELAEALSGLLSDVLDRLSGDGM